MATNLHSKPIIHEIFGFLLIAILVVLVLSQYNKPIISAATDQAKEYPYLSNIINSEIARIILQENSSKEEPVPDPVEETPPENPEPEPAPEVPKNWATLWGRASSESSGLTLSQEEGSAINGAFVYLDTVYASNDYDYKAELSGANAEQVSLVLRMQDSQHYTSCHFEDRTIRIVQTSEYGDKIITEKWINDQAAVLNPGTILAASVVGRQVSCSFNEHALAAHVSEIQPQGVAGIRVGEFAGTYIIPADENNPMRFGGGYPVVFSKIEVTPIIVI